MGIQAMKLRTALLSSALAVGLAAFPVTAATTENGYIVRQIDGERFEVLPKGGLSATDAWCAAGDFVIRFLRQPRATKIWRISEPPRGRNQSIVFSLSSEGAASTTGLSTSGGGASISASHGQDLCQAARYLLEND
jgi:hypothetical protein